MFTLKNNFHNTECKTRGGRLSQRTMTRIKNKLCGVKGCNCGDEIGLRGPQNINIEYRQDNNGKVIAIIYY